MRMATAAANSSSVKSMTTVSPGPCTAQQPTNSIRFTKGHRQRRSRVSRPCSEAALLNNVLSPSTAARIQCAGKFLLRTRGSMRKLGLYVVLLVFAALAAAQDEKFAKVQIKVTKV